MICGIVTFVSRSRIVRPSSAATALGLFGVVSCQRAFAAASSPSSPAPPSSAPSSPNKISIKRLVELEMAEKAGLPEVKSVGSSSWDF